MLKIHKPEKTVFALGLTLFYSCLSLWYFTAVDPKLYTKNAFGCGLTFANPIFYAALVATFIFAYSAFLRQKLRVVAFPVIAMAAILPLFYLLVDLKIGICASYPFGGNRGIYGMYAGAYITLFIALFSVLCGTLFRKLLAGKLSCPLELEDLKAHNLILHAPVFLYFAYCLALLFSKGLFLYAVCAFLLFSAAFSYEKVFDLLGKARAVFAGFARNEKLFLLSIFVLTLLIRYMWGARLLGIIGGNNFIMASDDGPCYDSFAAILAGGNILPRESLFAVSGFGYWYFLAAVYKIFGLHNFKAVFIIQSLIGSSVPVLTYLIAKKVFKSNLTAVLAGFMTMLSMSLIFLSVVIGMEAIYIPLVLLALFLAVNFFENGILNCKKAFLIGAAFGLAYNARPPELILFPFILGFIIFIFMRKKARLKKITLVAVSLLVGFIGIISVQYVRNYVIYGEKRFAPNAAAISFEVGSESGTFTDENKMLGDMGFNPFRDLSGAVSVFARNPFAVSTLLTKGFFKRLVVLWFIPNFGVFDPVYLVNPSLTYSGYFFRFPAYMQCYGSLLALLGMIVALVKKRNRPGVIILFSFLAYMSFRVAVFFVLNSRYRGVLMPAAIIFFAYGLEVLYRKIRSVYTGKPF